MTSSYVARLVGLQASRRRRRRLREGSTIATLSSSVTDPSANALERRAPLRTSSFRGEVSAERAARPLSRARGRSSILWKRTSASRWQRLRPAEHRSIALDAGGACDIVEDGVTGWLLPEISEKAVRSAVSRAARDKLDASEIRRRAERFASSRFRSELAAAVETMVETARHSNATPARTDGDPR